MTLERYNWMFPGDHQTPIKLDLRIPGFNPRFRDGAWYAFQAKSVDQDLDSAEGLWIGPTTSRAIAVLVADERNANIERDLLDLAARLKKELAS